VAAKCTLAARVDSFHESTEGKVMRKAAGCVRELCLGELTPGMGDNRGLDWGREREKEMVVTIRGLGLDPATRRLSQSNTPITWTKSLWGH